MRKFDIYWQSNRDWWEFKGFVAVLKPDAPKEAQESYRRYLEQTELYYQKLDSQNLYLKQFYNKRVRITADNDLVFLGKVNDYFYPEDNENRKESIVIDTDDGSAIEFYENSIKTIEIIE